MPNYCKFLDESGNKCCYEHAKYGPNGVIRFCGLHKAPEHVNKNGNSRVCLCGTRANWARPNDKHASVCDKCIDSQKEEMIRLTKTKCLCDKSPHYGFPGDMRPYRCVSCKSNGMIDISTSAKCLCGGGKQATFGILNGKKTRCVICKDEDMIDLSTKCKCGKSTPNFGLVGDIKATCCSKCKESNMKNIVSKMCMCGKTPTFGYEGDHVRYCCASCKTEDMIPLGAIPCKANESHNILCPQQGNKRYNNYCTTCFAHLFPGDPLTAGITTKSKEIKVVNYIATRYEGFLHDKPLYIDMSGGCCPSKRRIDLRKMIGNTMLCIEIDENQHARKSYKADDEVRYNDLFMDFSGKYIFIRFNPDSYRDSSGDCKNPDMRTRLRNLIKQLNRQISRIEQGLNTELVDIIKMYYNEPMRAIIRFED